MAARFTKPYVDALFEVAPVETIETLVPGLDAFSATLEHSEELRSLVRNPAVERTKKRIVVETIAEREGTAELGRRLLTALLGNGRLTSLAEVLRAIRDRLDHERHVVEATVRSAAPLDEAAQLGIRQALERRTRSNVRLKPVVDPALLGGFVVKIGSEVLDASLSHRLEKAKLALHGGGAGH